MKRLSAALSGLKEPSIEKKETIRLRSFAQRFTKEHLIFTEATKKHPNTTDKVYIFGRTLFHKFAEG
jgi:hypothetical protein